MKLDLDALHAIARDATPGPWEWRSKSGSVSLYSAGDANLVVALAEPCGTSNSSILLDSPDEAHIAAFDPPTALALIARVRQLEEERDALAHGLDRADEGTRTCNDRCERLEAALRDACDLAASFDGFREVQRIAELRKLVQG